MQDSVVGSVGCRCCFTCPFGCPAKGLRLRDETPVPDWGISIPLPATASARPADSVAPSLWRMLPSPWQVAADQTVQNSGPQRKRKRRYISDYHWSTLAALILPPWRPTDLDPCHKETSRNQIAPPVPDAASIQSVHVGRKAECGLPTRPQSPVRDVALDCCPRVVVVALSVPPPPGQPPPAGRPSPGPDDDGPLSNTAASSPASRANPVQPRTHVRPADRTRQPGVSLDGGQHESRPNHACREYGARVDCGVISLWLKPG